MSEGHCFVICQLPISRSRQSDGTWWGQEEALQALIIRVPPSFPGLVRDSRQAQRLRKRQRYITNWLISSEHKATQVTSPRIYSTDLHFVCWVKATHAREMVNVPKVSRLFSWVQWGWQVVLLCLKELLRTYCVFDPEVAKRNIMWLVDSFFLSWIHSTNMHCCLFSTTSRHWAGLIKNKDTFWHL